MIDSIKCDMNKDRYNRKNSVAFLWLFAVGTAVSAAYFHATAHFGSLVMTSVTTFYVLLLNVYLDRAQLQPPKSIIGRKIPDIIRTQNLNAEALPRFNKKLVLKIIVTWAFFLGALFSSGASQRFSISELRIYSVIELLIFVAIWFGFRKSGFGLQQGVVSPLLSYFVSTFMKFSFWRIFIGNFQIIWVCILLGSAAIAVYLRRRTEQDGPSRVIVSVAPFVLVCIIVFVDIVPDFGEGKPLIGTVEKIGSGRNGSVVVIDLPDSKSVTFYNMFQYYPIQVGDKLRLTEQTGLLAIPWYHSIELIK